MTDPLIMPDDEFAAVKAVAAAVSFGAETAGSMAVSPSYGPGDHAACDAEIARLRAKLAGLDAGARTLGKIITGQSRAMEAARIELAQGSAEKAVQWILNSLPDVWDDPETAWDGKESADEWWDRTDPWYRVQDAQTPAAGSAPVDTARALPARHESAQERAGTLPGESHADLLGMAWVVIANAGWDDCAKTPGWQEAAERWRDGYHRWLGLHLRHGQGEEEAVTADAGKPSAADRALVARATGGGIRSGDVQPALDEEKTPDA